MGLEQVRDSYSTVSTHYIDRFGRTWQDDDGDTAFVTRHLTGLSGPVLDLGCGPGHWTAHLHSHGAEITGVDIVPEFITHAQRTHPDVTFRLSCMTELDLPGHSVAGILSWYSTIHIPPRELDETLTTFRRLLQPGGVLVIGFFDSHDAVAPFDHAVTTAYRWPAAILSEHLIRAGFTEQQRRQHRAPDRPERSYAAIAATAT